MFGCPLTLLEHEAIEHFVDEVLEEGVIGPSDSPWSLLLLPVPKKDDECYQKLAGAVFHFRLT